MIGGNRWATRTIPTSDNGGQIKMVCIAQAIRAGIKDGDHDRLLMVIEGRMVGSVHDQRDLVGKKDESNNDHRGQTLRAV